MCARIAQPWRRGCAVNLGSFQSLVGETSSDPSPERSTLLINQTPQVGVVWGVSPTLSPQTWGWDGVRPCPGILAQGLGASSHLQKYL